MLLEHPLITERMFFPRTEPLAGPFRVSLPDAELACHRQAATAAGPPGDPARSPAARTFVHFHGNGEVVADYVPDHADAIAALGVDVCFAEYRGYGGSTGQPGLVRIRDDIPALIAALGKPTSELVIYGRSIGALYAVEVAHRYPDIAGLILESGIADLLERLLFRLRPGDLGASHDQLAAAVAEHFDHQRKLAGYRGPLLVIHARDDDILDLSHPRRNHDWAASKDKRLVLFERGGHNALLQYNWPRYLDTLREFLAATGTGS